MRRAVLLLLLASLRVAAQSNLLPLPASMEMRAGRFAASATFGAAVDGYTDARLDAAIKRFTQRIERRTGLDLHATDATRPTFAIHCDGPGQDVQGVDEDESYSLEVDAAKVSLHAATVVGAMRGLETLSQLLVADGDGYSFPAVVIKDHPRFPWRGLLIDVARHWEPVAVIKRNLDGMAAVKLNVFHWHLTEDQGFRIESKKFPKLQEMGSDGLFYTQDQVRDIVAYARDRGIRVIPEFDMPSHTTAWLVGYPELAAAPGPYQIVRKFGVFDGTLDPTREEVYTFLDAFLGEMAGLFPDAYLHIGGDENNGKQWNSNPAIIAFRKEKGLADNHALQAYFNQRLLVILTKYHKKMIGWDEILHPDLPKDIVVQSWRGADSLAKGARDGYLGILSAGYYLDHILPAAEHYRVDPLNASAGLSAAEAARILGGEACMWGEHVTPETIDSRIWPRLGAIAERLWSPPETRDVADMYRRLDLVSASLEDVGLQHLKARDMMLRRIAGGGDITALRTFVEALKPVSFGVRQRKPIVQSTPLVGLVDATPPDSREGRRIISLIDSRLKNRAELMQAFQSWQDARPALEALTGRVPELSEAKPLAVELAELGHIGAQALRILAHEMKAPPNWRARSLALLDRAKTPHAQVEFTVLVAMRGLVSAAAAGK